MLLILSVMVFSFVMVSLVVCVLFKQRGGLNALNQSPLLPLAFPPLFDSQCVYVVIAVGLYVYAIP